MNKKCTKETFILVSLSSSQWTLGGYVFGREPHHPAIYLKLDSSSEHRFRQTTLERTLWESNSTPRHICYYHLPVY